MMRALRSTDVNVGMSFRDFYAAQHCRKRFVAVFVRLAQP